MLVCRRLTSDRKQAVRPVRSYLRSHRWLCSLSCQCQLARTPASRISEGRRQLTLPAADSELTFRLSAGRKIIRFRASVVEVAGSGAISSRCESARDSCVRILRI